MRKSVAAAAMAASLTVGGAAGVALFTPALSGAQESGTTTTDTQAPDGPGSFLDDALAPLVANHTIDQSQADAVIAAIRDARPDGFPGHRGPRFLGDGTLTDVLGVSAADLRAALESGQSIADVAKAHDVAVQDVIDALVAKVQDRLDTAVANGRLTQDQADTMIAEATQHITDFVNGDATPGGRFDGHRPGPLGFGGPAADAPADTTNS